MKKKIASFDVFDTCLIRRCGRPVDFFDVFSFLAFKEEVDDNTRMAFLLSRIAADANLKKEDKSIEDIYNNLSFSHDRLYPSCELIRIELELERKMLAPVLYTHDLISKLRKEGYSIVFISDMYIHTDFIKSILITCGFFEEGDEIYVSCDIGYTKSSGRLFDYISQRENVSFANWIHHGDNTISDISIPSQKGIKTQPIAFSYSPYQQKWILSDYNTKFRYNSLMAGIGRSIFYSIPTTTHTLFTIDIVAPLIIPFVYNVFYDASRRGITDLYFFSRDAYSAYQVACTMVDYFKDIRPHYLYISQKALYSDDNHLKVKYFEQEKLASTTQMNAIVDIRSTGKSLEYINNLFRQDKKYNPVYAYILDIFCDGVKTHNNTDYYSVFNGAYNSYSSNGKYLNLSKHWRVFEMFFSPQNTPRTIGYASDTKVIHPIFSNEKTSVDCIVNNAEMLCEHQNLILKQYVKCFMQMQLFRYSDEIIRNIALPTLCDFFKYPNKKYLETLISFKVWNPNSEKYTPYIEKKFPLLFFFSTICKKLNWPTGSLVYSSPSFIPTKALVYMFRKNL